MKILLYTDNHFCEKASIVQGYGTKYSKRLENQLKSVNWAEDYALKTNCDIIVCLGDFFDKPDLNQYEITAAKDIKWANIPHYFIVGNHESGVTDLEFNSAKFLEGPNREIISQPTLKEFDDIELAFLPYVTESDRKPLSETFPKKTKSRIILSHNDIKGIQLGPVESRTGYTIDEIEVNSDLFINGHLHNGQLITFKVINLGNLTGKDFGEDATKYAHNIMILDTDTFRYELIENPYAFNFYKIDIEKNSDIKKIYNLKKQAIVSLKCDDSLLDHLKKAIDENKSSIMESRIIVSHSCTDSPQTESIGNVLQTGDHLQKLIDYCREKLGDSDILKYELGELCK